MLYRTFFILIYCYFNSVFIENIIKINFYDEIVELN